MKFEIDGHTAYAYTGGKALDVSLPGIVFVHGALHDHSVWALQSRYLAHHGHAVLAVDLPGHGRSIGPALSVADAARWLVQLVALAGLQRVALVGHSMGSLIALEAAAQMGGQVRALLMVCPAYPMTVSASLMDLARRNAEAAIDQVNVLSNSTRAARPSSPGPGFSIHGGNRAVMRRMQRDYPHGNLFVADFAACDRYVGLEAAAAKVRCQVTLVLGERDQMTPPKAAAPIAAALHPRKTVLLPAGHNLMAETPDGVLNAIVDALKQEAA